MVSKKSTKKSSIHKKRSNSVKKSITKHTVKKNVKKQQHQKTKKSFQVNSKSNPTVQFNKSAHIIKVKKDGKWIEFNMGKVKITTLAIYCSFRFSQGTKRATLYTRNEDFTKIHTQIKLMKEQYKMKKKPTKRKTSSHKKQTTKKTTRKTSGRKHTKKRRV